MRRRFGHLAPWPAEAVALARRCLERMVEIELADRSIALASLTFTSVIPLAVVVGSLSPVNAKGFAESLIDRFDLTGSTADLVRSLFAPPSDVRQTVSIVGSVLLVGSALSFTRGLQRVYERAWRLPPLGVRGTPAGLLWLAGMVLAVAVILPARAAVADATGTIPGVVLTLAVSTSAWLLTPFVLMSRRVPWRALVPTGALTALAMAALSAGSVIYMPHAIADSADRYGAIGIAIALVSWLVAAGFVLVGCAAIGAVLGEARASSVSPRSPAGRA